MKKVFIGLLFLILPAISAAQGPAPAGFTKLATGISATSFTDTSCPDGTTCYYYVTAVDSIGAESVLSNEAQGSVPSTGTHSVSLTWTASATTGVTYNVYQHVGPLPATNLKAVPL